MSRVCRAYLTQCRRAMVQLAGLANGKNHAKMTGCLHGRRSDINDRMGRRKLCQFTAAGESESHNQMAERSKQASKRGVNRITTHILTPKLTAYILCSRHFYTLQSGCRKSRRLRLFPYPQIVNNQSPKTVHSRYVFLLSVGTLSWLRKRRQDHDDFGSRRAWRRFHPSSDASCCC